LLIDGKTDERDVPVTPTLFVRLKRFAAAHASERIFMTNRRAGRSGQLEPLGARTVQNMVKYVAISAGITSKPHPHTFRHSFATQALRSGMNVIQLQKILGHGSLDMISRTYSHLTPEDSYDALLRMLAKR
jgi:integrase/recombinase XerD